MNEFREEQQSLDDNGDDPSAPSQALWQLGDQQLAQKFKTDLQTGLQTTVSDQRLVKDGLNQLQPVKKSWLRRLLKQFNNTISYVLLVTALISLLLQHYPDAIVIGIVIVANALIGYFQEASAADALSKLRSLLVAQTYVIRNGHKTLVPAKNLVRGDLVILEAGDQVPADLRLLSADNLTLQESILTGETRSVTKTEGPLSVAKLPLAERTNLAFAGTSVINGSGVGLVTATGQDTQLGQIQQAVTTAKPKLTPLMQNLNRLGWQLSLAIVLVAVIMFIIGAWMKIYSLPVLLIAVVTMVVGSMPEGMPASVSVVLAMGTRQLAQKHAIVKSLPAVETLGAVDIVNSDKTGTLTKNEMLVTDIMTATDQLQVENSSYGQRAILTDQQNQQVDWETLPAIKRLLQIAGQTTDAVFNLKAGRWQLVGEPTDGALTALYQSVVQKMPIVNEIDSLPFDSALRFSARLATIDQQRILFVKGAPETIFQLISRYQPDFVSQSWQQKMQQLTKQGKRVVALAYQKVAVSEAAIDQLKIGAGLHLVGLVGIIDPPRTEATDSVKKLLYAGVKVKMITGDDPDTAATIAHKLGLAEAIEVITGPEMDELSDTQLAKEVDRYTVFARTTPKDKLRIVKAQQTRGHIVAMTGDGVNDAPALKQADIGVAMGIKGTDVAKGAADIVLADDNFATIQTAVREGRHVFDNIRKSIRFLLPTSFAEGLIVVLSILLDQQLPLYPTQLLWINMVSALTIQFAFIFEPIEKRIMARGPRQIGRGILTKADSFEIAYVALLIAGLGIGAFDWLVGHGLPAAIGSTMTLNIIIFGKIFYLFNLRTHEFAFSKTFFQNKMAFWIIGVLLALQLLIIYAPFMQDIFHTTSIGLFWGWILPALLGMVVLMVTEIVKLFKKILNKKILKIN
ncbi:HAD-IC family P-type ATPase [Liquorilactobacillus vini]|uniref:Cation transport ATPase n=1 Tax=Liquorilactobacillus vini DSM 20605 TaxID=1133569 RepID=A0A0R2CK90_9LACO|nr:HAD-IC family P-type ATPase [Liquorilactobacillus vini]KRM88534.1 cation transport ATPase [Liquorilactobacillus vini DSM 20605]